MVPLISVVIPTVDGREDQLARTLGAYASQAPGAYRLNVIVVHNLPCVGAAWQQGAGSATGDYLHLGNDDTEPHPGWHLPAIESAGAGILPAPQVYGPAGEPQSLPEWGKLAADGTPVSMSTIPFCAMAQWEKISPLDTRLHYYADDFFSFRGKLAGYPVVLRSGYAFTHQWAQPGRGAGMSEGGRMVHDLPLYQESSARVLAGQWP